MTAASLGVSGESGERATPAQLVAWATVRGVRLSAAGGTLRYASAGPMPEDVRAVLTAHKPALAEYLGRWDAAEAIRLEIAADDTVARLGVDGRHPSIQGPAARAVESHQRHDLAGVAAAAAEVEAAAHKLASEKPGR